MNIKYSVRPIDKNFASESIFETYNLVEALKKVEEQNQENNTKCIIVSCDAELRPLEVKLSLDKI
jgi:hypothetical protein